jgi:hypothetical protein
LTSKHLAALDPRQDGQTASTWQLRTHVETVEPSVFDAECSVLKSNFNVFLVDKVLVFLDEIIPNHIVVYQLWARWPATPKPSSR